MFSAFEWMVALRYLRARRQEGFISVIAWFSLLGISLGVATLIIVMAVMNGFRHELLGRILGLNGHVMAYGSGGVLEGFDDVAANLRKIPGVVSVAPIAEGQVMATAQGVARGALVRGIRPEDLKAHATLMNGLKAGDLAEFEGNDAVIVGARLLQHLNLEVGQRITLISPKSNITALGSVPRMKAYRVVASFNVGMYEYDSTYVYMPLPAAQVYFQLGEGVTFLEIKSDDPDRARRIAIEVVKAEGNRLGRILDWQQINASFFNAIQVERNVMFLILTLIILVAAFNIISSLIMLVKDKGRDIAILRTMGATRGMILRVFFIAGASVGVIGTLGGFGLGLAFSLNIESIRQFIQSLSGTELFAAEIYFLSHLPARVEAGEVIAVVLMGIGLSLAATIYPSWRAARLDPVEALRYE